MNTRDQEWLLRDKYGGVESAAYLSDIEALKKGEHVSYLIGWVPFLGCKIGLESRPLIPRPETEWWTEQVIRHVHTRKDTQVDCLDLFTGSGCIGIAILVHESRSHVTFGDINSAYLKTVEMNILRNHIDTSRAKISETDVFSKIDGLFDIITANPPYIDIKKRNNLEHELGVEPASALYANDAGLQYIQLFLNSLKKHLKQGGKAFMEFDSGQEKAIGNIAKKAGLTITFFNDQYGVPRFLMAE